MYCQRNVESTGTFICSLLGSILFDFEILPNFPLLGYHGRILTQSMGTLCLVLSAFHFTGGFYHPVLATIRTYGCRGYFQNISTLDHFAVYWVGSTFGAVTAYYIFTMWKKGRSKTDTEKKIHRMMAWLHYSSWKLNCWSKKEKRIFWCLFSWLRKFDGHK